MGGFEYALESEFNRFNLPHDQASRTLRVSGDDGFTSTFDQLLLGPE